MKLQVEVDEATGTVINAKFKTFGCGSAIASSSVATEWLIGKKVDDCLSITVSSPYRDDGFVILMELIIFCATNLEYGYCLAPQASPREEALLHVGRRRDQGRH